MLSTAEIASMIENAEDEAVSIASFIKQDSINEIFTILLAFKITQSFITQQKSYEIYLDESEKLVDEVLKEKSKKNFEVKLEKGHLKRIK